MKDKKKHPDENELIEYFYKESVFPEAIKRHLHDCKRCNSEYLRLKEDLEYICVNFRKGFWSAQSQGIMSEIQGMRRRSLRNFLWKPVFVTAILAVLIIGIYFQVHHTTVMYTQRDVKEELILEEVSRLVDQPLTSALDFLDFQEEEKEQYDYTFERFDLFDYWPELDNMYNIEEREV